MKVKIIDLHPADAYYDVKEKYKGLIGDATDIISCEDSTDTTKTEFVSCYFKLPNETAVYFHAVKLDLVLWAATTSENSYNDIIHYNNYEE